MSSPAKVSVIGCCGSGKTTLSKQLEELWNLERIELDAIRHLPKWQERPNDEFTEILSQRVKTPRYVIDGNYGFARHIYWTELDMVILLDYPFGFVFRRLLWRTVRRSAKRELLWGVNRESFVKSFLTRDSIMLWLVKTHKRRHLFALEVEKNPPNDHCKVLRFTHPKQTHSWLESQGKSSST